MKKRRISLMLCTLLLAAGCTGCKPSESAESFPYIVSANAGEGTVTAYVCNRFDEELKKSTDGELNGHVYLNGTLGNDTDVAEQVMSGHVQFLCTNTANLVTMIPELAVLDMPGVLTNLEQARGVMDDPVFRGKLDEIFAKHDLKLLILSDQGFRQTSSNKALRTLADFKGLGIRTMENSLHMAYWKALGANPTPMNRSEVFISLQQGLLEAQEDPYCSILANNYAEVQKYIIETNHIFSNVIFVTNLDYYNSLSEEHQQKMQQVCADLLEESRQYCDQSNETALAEMQEQGMEYIKIDQAELEKIGQVAQERVEPLVRKQAGDEMTELFLTIAQQE